MTGKGSREKILNRLRGASGKNSRKFSKVPLRGAIYNMPTDSLVKVFKKELEAVSGHCYLCANTDVLKEKVQELTKAGKWQNIFLGDSSHVGDKALSKEIPLDLDAAFISCEAFVARTGSVLISSSQPGGRQINVFPPTLVVIGRKSQVFPFIGDAFRDLQERKGEGWPSMVSIMTGPSRTADIEKTLILGAHGPKELIILIDLSN